MKAVGKGKDSPASERLIQVVDKDDPRPVWVTVWGGPNVLAQALWKVRETRSKEELEKLSQIVEKHDLFLFADEVYREFCYDGVNISQLWN